MEKKWIQLEITGCSVGSFEWQGESKNRFTTYQPFKMFMKSWKVVPHFLVGHPVYSSNTDQIYALTYIYIETSYKVQIAEII